MSKVYIPHASSNLGDGLPRSHWGRRLKTWLNQHKTVIDLADAADVSRYPNLQIPDWLRTLTRAWLVIPLIHRDLLQGFIVLGQ